LNKLSPFCGLLSASSFPIRFSFAWRRLRRTGDGKLYIHHLQTKPKQPKQCVCVCVSPTGLNNRSPKAQATCGSGRHYLEATRTRAGVVKNQNKYLKLGLISLLPSDGPANMQGRMALVLALPSSHVSGRHTASELTQSPFNPLSTATYQSLYKHYHWFHVILMASQQPFAGWMVHLLTSIAHNSKFQTDGKWNVIVPNYFLFQCPNSSIILDKFNHLKSCQIYRNRKRIESILTTV